MMKRSIYFAIVFIIVAMAILSCSRSAVKEQEAPRVKYDRAMQFYDKGKYTKAQSEFLSLIYSFPGQTYIDTAQYYLGMSYYNISNYTEAAAEFKRLLDTYPSSPFADDAQYQTGMCHFKESPSFAKDQAETNQAIDEFTILLNRYPNSPLLDDARVKLNQLYDKLAKKMYMGGELYLKLNDYGPAILYFSQVRDNYPSTEWAKLAFYYTGVAQMKNGQKAEALETFQNFVTAFPDHKLSKKAQKAISKLQPERAGG